MEFKAKIKPRTQCFVRGTRLFPTQVFTADSNKSIHVQGDLINNSCHNIDAPNQIGDQPEVSRYSNRHTTEITVERPAYSRLSLEQIPNNRLQRIDSSFSNMSDRSRFIQIQSEKKIPQQTVADQETRSSLKRSLLENNQTNGFRDLRIQRITSNQAKLDRSLNQNYYQKAAQKQEKLLQMDKKQTYLQRPNEDNNIWETLYTQIKEKYSLLQKDYLQLVTKMKVADEQISTLQKDRDLLAKKVEESSSLKMKVEQQEKKIAKLEESVRINRNINDMLMKKDKQNQNKIKILQQNHEKTLKQKVNQAKKLAIQQTVQKYESINRANEKQVFELKLKLIDQSNQFQQNCNQNHQKYISLQNENRQLLEDISRISHQKMSIFNELAGIRLQLEAKNAELSSIQEQCSMLSSNLYYANLEIQKLTTEIVRIDQENIRLDQQNIRLNHENQNNLAVSQDRINQFVNQVLILENQKYQIIKLLQEKQTYLEQQCKKNNDYRSQIEEINKQLKAKIKQEEQQTLKKVDKQTVTQKIKEKQNEWKQRLDDVNEKMKEIIDQNEMANKEKQLKIQIFESQLIAQNTELQNKIDILSAEIQDLKQAVVLLKAQHEQQLIQKCKQYDDAMSQHLLSKLQIMDSYKKISEENKTLQKELNLKEKINEQLMLLKTQFSQQKWMLEQQSNQKEETINELKSEIESFKQLQMQRAQDLKQKQSVIQSRENELKEVEKQYLELIEGELKKIHNMNVHSQDEAQLEPADHLLASPAKSKNHSFLDEELSQSQTPKKSHGQQQISSPQQERQLNVSELTEKIEELTFVNEALRQKVEELTELQEKSNEIIIQKIRSFESNLERALMEKAEVDFQNNELLHRIQQLDTKCIQYQGKIEWLQNLLPMLQQNLFCTQEELLKSHFQIVNLKLMSQLDQQEALSEQQQQLDYQKVKVKLTQSQNQKGQASIQAEPIQVGLLNSQSDCGKSQKKEQQSPSQKSQQLVDEHPEVKIKIISIDSEGEENEKIQEQIKQESVSQDQIEEFTCMIEHSTHKFQSNQQKMKQTEAEARKSIEQIKEKEDQKLIQNRQQSPFVKKTTQSCLQQDEEEFLKQIQGYEQECLNEDILDPLMESNVNNKEQVTNLDEIIKNSLEEQNQTTEHNPKNKIKNEFQQLQEQSNDMIYKQEEEQIHESLLSEKHPTPEINHMPLQVE